MKAIDQAYFAANRCVLCTQASYLLLGKKALWNNTDYLDANKRKDRHYLKKYVGLLRKTNIILVGSDCVKNKQKYLFYLIYFKFRS